MQSNDVSGAKIIYFLEGNLVYENQKIKNKSAAPIYSALWSITFGTDIDLFQTKNVYHTCMCIQSICKKIKKKGKFWKETLTKEDYQKVLSSKKKNNKNPEQCARDMLSCIHGISFNMADSILKEFGSIPKLCTAINNNKYMPRINTVKIGNGDKKRKLPKTVVKR